MRCSMRRGARIPVPRADLRVDVECALRGCHISFASTSSSRWLCSDFVNFWKLEHAVSATFPSSNESPINSVEQQQGSEEEDDDEEEEKRWEDGKGLCH